MHRRQRTLHKELKDAEAALAGEPSDANLARLVDIQKQLAKREGTEALIEGFGASSGRQARAVLKGAVGRSRAVGLSVA